MVHLHETTGGGQQWKDQHRNSSLATIGKESLFLPPLCIDFPPPPPHEAGFLKEQMILLHFGFDPPSVRLSSPS
jgi:hypothetical protein